MIPLKARIPLTVNRVRTRRELHQVIGTTCGVSVGTITVTPTAGTPSLYTYVL